jgi:glycosyltransferase involved in cell wall biosynthesis
MSPPSSTASATICGDHPSAPSYTGVVRMIAVIPLYRANAEDSPGFRTLRTAASCLPSELGSVQILLYDNTPRTDLHSPPRIAGNVKYYSSGRNDGLAAAFNYALQVARNDKCDWLITLDQDTEVPSDFLARIARAAKDLGNEVSVAAIVPQIIGDGRTLSPNWFWAGALPRWFPKGYVGISSHPTYAFNSASALRVSALRQIGDYSPWFWLDNCDSYLFHRLHLYGKRLFVAGDIEVKHEFSMLDKRKRMSISRYRNVLMAESAFWDLSMNRLAGWERTVRLMGRWCKLALDSDSHELRDETARAVKRRLFVSRGMRIEEWKRETVTQRPWIRETAAHNHKTAQKISVCMATYNGKRFVHEQLVSILQQLRPEDEVIVVDDRSTDSTSEIVTGTNDVRILLIEHRERQGIVGSFEHAVRSASGDIVFLCDQDDIWAPTKVSKVMKVFAEQPTVSLVTTNHLVIDDEGRPCVDKKLRRRSFDHRLMPNLFSNRFQGSTMAFRATLLPSLLPFPKGCYVLHDAWIGLRNTAIGGRCEYLDEDLLFYRRHTHNASYSVNLLQKALKRLRLVVALVLRGQPPAALS